MAGRLNCGFNLVIRCFCWISSEETCLAGAESRIGKPREDMPWVETESDEEFRQWILDFPQNEMPAVYELIDRYRQEKSMFIFRSREDIENYLEKTFG